MFGVGDPEEVGGEKFGIDTIKIFMNFSTNKYKITQQEPSLLKISL